MTPRNHALGKEASTPVVEADCGLCDQNSTCDQHRPHNGAGLSGLPLLHHVTGISWAWYWGNKELLGLEGRWQLMPADPLDEGAFWNWHVVHARQWFNCKSAAVQSLLRSYRSYQRRELAEKGDV